MPEYQQGLISLGGSVRGMTVSIIPVSIASPDPRAYRSLPEHRSKSRYISIRFNADPVPKCTFARLSASGMSLSASLVKSFSGFNRPADMMTNRAGEADDLIEDDKELSEW